MPTGGSSGQALLKSSATDYDAAWQTLTKASVGLANTDNTSDAAKPISTATQTALNGKASLSATKGYVSHGSTASTPRPSGYTSVEWHGSVQPSNAVAGDTWVDTA